jgi:oligopeptide transport system permease protein
MEKNYSKDYFTLVKDEERLQDKPLKTKQLTYFQDAMLRFGKNRYNVIASIILGLFILLSIVVPMITPKDLYDKTNSALILLPPRVPLVEQLGILDGTKYYKNQTVDPTTIEDDSVDGSTELGYPSLGFDPEFIDFDTLENYEITGSTVSPYFVGGTNELFVMVNKTAYSIYDSEAFVYGEGDYLLIDIVEMDATGVLEVYFLDTNEYPDYINDTSWEYATLLDTITSSNVTDEPYRIDLDNTVFYDENSNWSYDSGIFFYRYVLDNPSEIGADSVELESIGLYDINDQERYYDWGYDLATYKLYSTDPDTENGVFIRQDAIMMAASFEYNVYDALFSDSLAIYGKTEYDEVIEQNPEMLDAIIDCQVEWAETDDEYQYVEQYCGENTLWIFVDEDGGQDFPITGVESIETKTILGRTYYNYKVYENGRYSLGFETIPYFVFGTDVFGKDLFTLIWLGLRTSLMLGFFASITNIFFGIIWGSISAYYGGQTDMLMERFTDIWGSFPQITMISIISVYVGPGFWALYIFLVYDGWIGVSRITRMQFYRFKGREYVLAARTLGAGDRRIIFKHILPNALGTIVTRVILSIPAVIFLEVNLSFLGFGIGNGQTLEIGPLSLTGTSIGVILNDGQQQILAGNTWMIIFPTLIVSILMITFNMFGNALRDALNPQLRGSE